MGDIAARHGARIATTYDRRARLAIETGSTRRAYIAATTAVGAPRVAALGGHWQWRPDEGDHAWLPRQRAVADEVWQGTEQRWVAARQAAADAHALLHQLNARSGAPRGLEARDASGELLGPFLADPYLRPFVRAATASDEPGV
jgi:hypothetical protein